jgi:hypothetical protein
VRVVDDNRVRLGLRAINGLRQEHGEELVKNGRIDQKTATDATTT